jgi:hypothetical protein
MITATAKVKQNPTVFSDTLPKHLSQRYVAMNQIATIGSSVKGFTARKSSNRCMNSSIAMAEHHPREH